MNETTTDTSTLEQLILDYLNEHGKTPCLTISADLDTNPLDTLDALERLQEQGRVAHIDHPHRFPRPIPPMS